MRTLPDRLLIALLAGVCVFSTALKGRSQAAVQQWSKTFGGTGDDRAGSLDLTRDGGYIVAGWTARSASDPDEVCLIKIDAGGHLQWRSTLGTTDDVRGYSVAQTSDGGYIVAGRTGIFRLGLCNVYLLKSDSRGKQQWSRTFGGSGDERCYCVQQTSDDGYLVVGFTHSFGAGYCDVYLVKTDEDGNEEWSKTFGGSLPDCGFHAEETADGGYIVTGDTFSASGSSSDLYLVKTDSNGNEIWSRTYGGSDADRGYCVRQTPDGGYIVAGRTRSWGAGSHDVYLVKTDVDGNELWSKTFGGRGDDMALSVDQTTDGGYIIAGITLSFGSGWEDAYLIKTHANGNKQWTKTYGGAQRDLACSVRQTPDGGYILTGETFSFGAGRFDVYVIKTDAQGNAPPPKPVVSTISLKQFNVSITFRTLSGTSYQLECCDDLQVPDWVSLGQPLAGTGDMLTLSDPTGGFFRRRFYRVLSVP